MKIRPLAPADFAASLTVITQACAAAPHHSGHEADRVTALRQSDTYHPEYDVGVFTDAGQLVGTALLAPATVVGTAGTWPVFVLAALAVLPAFQHQGIASALRTYLEVQAGEDARRALALVGDPAYYGRFGYRPAAQFHIAAPAAGPSVQLLLKPIVAGGLTNVAATLRTTVFDW